MNEPTRLLSSPESELERALLHAGRSYTASGSARAKTLVALGISAAATSSAPSAAAASSSLTKATVSKMAVAVLVIGAVTVPVWRYLGRHASAPVEHAPASAAPRLPLAPAAIESAPIEPAPNQSEPVEMARVEATEPQPAPRVPRPGAGRAPAKAASAPPLSAELAALDAARTSLSHSDPRSALVALDAYGRDFPHGRLKIEAEVLRIGALAKSGQGEAARTRAEAFLRAHPDSVLASRVRSYAGL